MKYRIKQYEALCTRYKGGKWATEQVETRYQIEMREAGFWGYIWGWSDIGGTLDTEEAAKNRVALYKNKVSVKEPNNIRYINID
jgi:hypothetical protein